MTEEELNINGHVSQNSIDQNGYRENIKRRYRNIPTEKLREIVANYKSRSLLEKIFCFSSAEKIEIGVAKEILERRDKITGIEYLPYRLCPERHKS